VTQIYVNLGKSLGIYQRLRLPARSRFIRYVENIQKNKTNTDDGLSIISKDETDKLSLFTGEVVCIDCHNDPLTEIVRLLSTKW